MSELPVLSLSGVGTRPTRPPRHLADLDPERCREAIEMILAGVASPAQAASFLMVGRAKGNSASELAATSRAMPTPGSAPARRSRGSRARCSSRATWSGR